MLGTNTKMLFITAGMGGGTGTGASPVLAKAAKELGILTVAIITTPFTFEGKRRRSQAEEGLSELRKYVDSYLVISNDRLREIFGNLTMTAAFAKADDILTTAAKGIAEIITIPGYVNVDFKDVRTVMNDSGVAIMGNAIAEGEDRALRAVEGALASPLLKDNEIEGARYILLNITSGTKEVTMDEVAIITDYIQEKAGLSADLIWGNCIDENFEDELSVTIIATGFQTSEERDKERENTKVSMPLTAEPANSFIKPVSQVAPREVPATNSFVTPVQRVDAPVPSSNTPTPNNLQSDLFTSPRNAVQQQVAVEEPQVIRHDLGFDGGYEEETSFGDSDFQLKTSPSVFQFQMPTVFDSYAAPSASGYEEKPTFSSSTTNEQVEVPQVEEEQVSFEDQLVRTKERILRLKELSMKLKSSNGLHELENEPAYKRKQMSLEDTPHSSQSQVSRFTLSFEDGNTEIRPNNSFLHDNVD
ncbi:Cell division protein FtsZ [compost metagenome]